MGGFCDAVYSYKCWVCGVVTPYYNSHMPSGHTVPKADPVHYGARVYVVNGVMEYICPEHSISLLVDGDAVHTSAPGGC